MLRTGRRCTWEEIEVGEVFAWNGCWVIAQKINEDRFIALQDSRACFCSTVNVGGFKPGEQLDWRLLNSTYDFYKLPKSVQRLWKEE